jgi:choline dehydrogenase-like flavoprotein
MLYIGLALLGLYPRLSSGLGPSPMKAVSRNYRQHLSNVRRDPKLARGAMRVLSELARKWLGQKVFALANPENRYLLRYHAEQVPDAENRAVLSDQQDGAALSRLRVDFRFQPQDIESVLGSHDIIDQWLQRERIGRLEYLVDAEKRSQFVLEQALDGYHQLGLTRMSEEQKDGVVDRDCRVHDVANLFVAGSSVFPTAGQANPTLPAVALALRLGDYLGRAAASARVA